MLNAIHFTMKRIVKEKAMYVTDVTASLFHI